MKIKMLIVLLSICILAGCSSKGGADKSGGNEEPNTSKTPTSEASPTPEAPEPNDTNSPDDTGLFSDSGSTVEDSNRLFDNAVTEGYITDFIETVAAITGITIETSSFASEDVVVSGGDTQSILFGEGIELKTADVNADGGGYSMSPAAFDDLEPDSFVLIYGQPEAEDTYIATTIIIVNFV